MTDAYQPAERRLCITRSVIEVLAEARHPFSVITKSSLVERDIDLIAPMAREGMAAVYVSITTLDPALARTLEPRAAAPHRRLRTIEALARAGIPVGVSVSPVIPFLNEPELERILQAARNAGASRAFSIVLRLPWEVSPLFQQWLQQQLPERAERIMARVREMRGGKDNDSRFGTRMTGQGVWAQLPAPARRRHPCPAGRAGSAVLRRGPGLAAGPDANWGRRAYLNRSLTRSAQLLLVGEWRSPDLRNDSSSSFSSLRWCSVSLTGVSTLTWQYRSPG